MRYLYAPVDAAYYQAFFAPVKLERFAKFKCHWHKGLKLDLPQFDGRLNVSELKRFECNPAGLSTVLGGG